MREAPNASATLRLVSMYAAMRGSRYATDEDKQYAAWIEKEFPGTRALMQAVAGFHSRALAWAVTDGGCAGGLVAARGFPDKAPPWHAEALRLAPGARVGYVTGHPAAARMCAAEYGPGATCWAATTLDPDAVLESPQGRSLGRPLHLQFHMLLHHLSGATCAWMLGEYARRIGPGSSVAVSCWLPGGSPEGHELAAMIAASGWPVHAHSEGDLRRWVSRAGMRLHSRGIADVRDWGRALGGQPGGGISHCWRERPEGRIVEAVALVPRR